jgi:hypothetical protein
MALCNLHHLRRLFMAADALYDRRNTPDGGQ